MSNNTPKFNKKNIYHNYHKTHSQYSSEEVYSNENSQWDYYQSNYIEIFRSQTKSSKILEIGCGGGSLLLWLRNFGFRNLTGVELSTDDVNICQSRGLNIINIDAKEHLNKNKEEYDIIILKAVFEHFTKEEGFELLKLLSESLKNQGILIIDVPNMDWIFASHERYMDITHDTGFTQESLRQTLGFYFPTTTISGSKEIPKNFKQFVRISILKRLVVFLIKKLLILFGEGASNIMFESRSLISISKKSK